MKRGLSLIPIVGGGVSLILAGVLLVYTRMLGDYGETGALYLLSMMMEEEGPSPSATRKTGYAGAGQLLLPGSVGTAGCRRNSGRCSTPLQEHRRHATARQLGRR